MKQGELKLFEHAAAKSNVKKVQMKHLNLSHSVMVDLDAGTIEHLRGKEMAYHNFRSQLAVLSENWLERLTYAVGQLRALTDRQQRERQHMLDLVQEVMDESQTLDGLTLPDRVHKAFAKAVHGEGEAIPADGNQVFYPFGLVNGGDDDVAEGGGGDDDFGDDIPF